MRYQRKVILGAVAIGCLLALAGISQVDLTKQVFGNLQVANEVISTNTVAKDGFFSNGLSPESSFNSSNANITQSTMFVLQLTLTRSYVIGHATIDVTTGGTSESMVICLYKDLASAPLWQTSTTVNTAGVVATSATQYTAMPGLYYVAWGQTGTTAAAYTNYPNIGVPQAAIMNATGVRWGTATGSGSVCPATLSTLTAISTATAMPAILFEP
jgi:hypothetical protein